MAMMAIVGIVKGRFLDLPYVRRGAHIGITSLIAAIGLHALGFPYNQNLATAACAIVAVGGGATTGIGAVVYYMLFTGKLEWEPKGWHDARRKV
jgi:hypothetical protein